MADTETVETAEETAADVAEDVAEEIADEIADVVADEIDPPDVEVNAVVVEAEDPPEIPETSYVDVGDLHISGPPDMVERITGKYLKDHIDHNPHDVAHTVADTVDETAESITPDVVEEQIQESAADEIDTPPAADDWLFRNRRGQ